LESGLRALRLLRKKGIQARMEVAGRGPALGHFERLAAALGLTDVVTFRGHLSYKEVAGLLARATVGLLSFPDTPFMRCGATLKLAECMASGLPVVATDVGETAATVRRTGAGIVVGASPEQIAEGMTTLLKDPALRRRLGRHGRRAAERLNWNNLAEEQANVLLGALEQSGHKPTGAERPSSPMGTRGD
jgi:glycosyltransferase involved in cell wall biosynthesis